MEPEDVFLRLAWYLSLWNYCFFHRHGFIIIFVTCNELYAGVPRPMHGHLCMLFEDKSLKFITNENFCRSEPVA